MKIKRIIFVVIIIIISLTTNIYAAKIPGKNASSSEISKYLETNDASLVSIETLCSWFTTAQTSTTDLAKIDTALKNKNEAEIKTFCNKSNYDTIMPSSEREKVFAAWKDKVSDSDLKSKLEGKSNEAKEKREDDKAEAEKTKFDIDPNWYDASKEKSSDSKAMKKVGKIVGAVQGFGSVVSLGVLVYIGIRYKVASVEEKAMYKETMIPYVIGSILVFSGSNIVGIIYNVFY